MAVIGDTPDAHGQTWYLPIGPDRLTYAEMSEVAGKITGRRLRYTVLPEALFRIGSHFAAQLGMVYQLLPRHCGDSICDTTKFATRFSDFRATSYREGITGILGS